MQTKPQIGHFYSYEHGDWTNLALCYHIDKTYIETVEYDNGGDDTLYFNRTPIEYFCQYFKTEEYNQENYWFENFFNGADILFSENKFFSKNYAVDSVSISRVKEALTIFKTLNRLDGGYQDYLQTIKWKRIRNRKLSEIPFCQVCGATNHLEVHHCTYAHICDEDNHMNDLTVLCHNCHSLFHSKR